MPTNKKNRKSEGVLEGLKSTVLIMASEMPTLMDPDIATNPLAVVAKFCRNVASRKISQLIEEYKIRTDNGELKKPDEFKTEKPVLTLIELLKYLEENITDDERFRALKSILFTAAAKNSSEEDEIFAYEFLQAAKKLSGTEILILKANFELACGNVSSTIPGDVLKAAQTKRNVWKIVIEKQMRYRDFRDVVTKYETNLEFFGLISPRNEDNRFQGEFEPTSKFRLTGTGYKFCEFITNYPSMKQ